MENYAYCVQSDSLDVITVTTLYAQVEEVLHEFFNGEYEGVEYLMITTWDGGHWTDVLRVDRENNRFHQNRATVEVKMRALQEAFGG